MKRSCILIALIALAGIGLSVVFAQYQPPQQPYQQPPQQYERSQQQSQYPQSQPHRQPRDGGMMGSGGMRQGGIGGGRCPMCGRPWDGVEQSYNLVPTSLPKPQNPEWLANLRQVLGLEKLSRNQYTKDSRAHEARMPYSMIIPQERNHIAWIEALFAAYGVSATGQVPASEDTESLAAAYELAVRLETNLIPRYEWLIGNVEDQQSASVLDTILLQTRMHQTMFAHALRMLSMAGGRGMMRGGMMGGGMGRGMMGGGMGRGMTMQQGAGPMGGMDCPGCDVACGALAHVSATATSDGGVVVAVAGKLIKYDSVLKKVSETDLDVDWTQVHRKIQQIMQSCLMAQENQSGPSVPPTGVRSTPEPAHPSQP